MDAFVELSGSERSELASRGTRGMIVVGKKRIAPERKHGGAELIIHDCIPLAAQQPGAGITPLFAGNVAIGIDSLDSFAETFPIVIVGVINRARIYVAADI